MNPKNVIKKKTKEDNLNEHIKSFFTIYKKMLNNSLVRFSSVECSTFFFQKEEWFYLLKHNFYLNIEIFISVY